VIHGQLAEYFTQLGLTDIKQDYSVLMDTVRNNKNIVHTAFIKKLSEPTTEKDTGLIINAWKTLIILKQLLGAEIRRLPSANTEEAKTFIKDISIESRVIDSTQRLLNAPQKNENKWGTSSNIENAILNFLVPLNASLRSHRASHSIQESGFGDKNIKDDFVNALPQFIKYFKDKKITSDTLAKPYLHICLTELLEFSIIEEVEPEKLCDYITLLEQVLESKKNLPNPNNTLPIKAPTPSSMTNNTEQSPLLQNTEEENTCCCCAPRLRR
jgi:hypothetical protein